VDEAGLFLRSHPKPDQSKFRGVFPHGSKWRTIYAVKNVTKKLGMFVSEEEAAKAYRDEAYKHDEE
jgi:hypothetical protein